MFHFYKQFLVWSYYLHINHLPSRLPSISNISLSQISLYLKHFSRSNVSLSQNISLSQTPLSQTPLYQTTLYVLNISLCRTSLYLDSLSSNLNIFISNISSFNKKIRPFLDSWKLVSGIRILIFDKDVLTRSFENSS